MRSLLISFFLIISFSSVSYADWQITQQLGGMSTEVYLPATSPVLNSKRALMVMLHGCGQNAYILKSDGNWATSAEEFGMVVAIPLVPEDGVEGDNCWDYYGTNHARTTRNNVKILSLVSEMINDAQYNIDPEQVYIAGISSGGSQAQIVACLAPDVFAGVSVVAAASIGSAYSIDAVPDEITKDTARDLCIEYAGGNASYFQTQIASIEYGNAGTVGDDGTDGMVHKQFNTINADMFAQIYSAAEPESGEVVPGVYTLGDGVQVVWPLGQKEVVSKIETENMPHAWPSGDLNPSPDYAIASGWINYPKFVTEWFFANNRRINSEPPVCVEHTSTLNTHNSAGRVYTEIVAGWWWSPGTTTWYAVGSDENLGTDGSLTVTLKEDPQGYYTQGTCPIDDTTPPQITLNGNNPLYISIGDDYSEPGYSAQDNIDGDITNQVVVTGVVNTSAAGSYTKYYNVSDVSGNNAQQKTRTVIVETDTTIPVITLSGNNPMSVSIGSVFVEPGFSAHDNVDGNISNQVIVTGDVNTSIAGTYYKYYNVSDAAGNSAEQGIREIVVEPDTVAPVIALLGSDSMTLYQGASFSEPGYSAQDNVDGNISAAVIVMGSVNPAILGIYTLKYNVSDAAGNSAQERVRIVNVVEQPTCTDYNVSIALHESAERVYSETTAGWWWNNGTTTWFAVGSNENLGTNSSAIVSLKEDPQGYFSVGECPEADITPPQILLSGSNPLNISVGADYSELGYSATDNVDGDITSQVVVTGTVDTSTVGTYHRYYNVSDAAGNNAIQKARIINVTPDIIAPVIMLGGSGSMTIYQNSSYSEPGYSATDDVDGNITEAVEITGGVNASIIGVYYLSYNVSDAAGNAAQEKIRTVTVIAQPTCNEYTFSLAVHESNGRAYTQTTNGWWWNPSVTTWYAEGSDQKLGTISSTIITLKEDPQGYFSTGNCPQ